LRQTFQYSNFQISRWGEEQRPITFTVEPEFGLSGYLGIIRKELSWLDRLINTRKVGSAGEIHAGPVLEAPEITLQDNPGREVGRSDRKVVWQLRYGRDYRGECIGYLSRLFYTGMSLLPLSSSKQKAYALLVPHFSSTRFFLCLDTPFWLENRDFIKKYYTHESRAVLTNIEMQQEPPASVRVPMQRANMTSLESWLNSQPLSVLKNFFLVLDGRQYAEVIKLIDGKTYAGQRILLLAREVGQNISAEWHSVVQLKPGWWLLEGPRAAVSDHHPLDDDRHGGSHIRSQEKALPRISVIVISYNQAEFIEDCLRSIVSQGYPDMELIVVDGKSTDGTCGILERYREYCAHLIIETDRCQSEALNKGFRLATGEVMTWICSDDFLEEGALLEVGQKFREHEIDIIAGGCRIVDEHGVTLFNHQNGLPMGEKIALSFGDLLSFLGLWSKGLYFYQPDIFFSRRIWLASGAYIKEHLYYAMDYDLFLRFAMAGALVLHLPAFLASRRLHKRQKTQHATPLYLPTIRNLLKEYELLIKQANSSIEEQQKLSEDR